MKRIFYKKIPYLLLALLTITLIWGCASNSRNGIYTSVKSDPPVTQPDDGTDDGNDDGTDDSAGHNDFYPDWADITPLKTISLNYDSGRTAEENGVDLVHAVAALQPGDKLEIGAGIWSVNRWWNIVVEGTALAPIWIEAAPGAEVVITRPDGSQNVMNLGAGSGNTTAYLCIRGLEITGGSDGMKLYSCHNVWIDQCHIHHIGAVGIAANAGNTHHLYITSNHIHHTDDTAEGMYLGSHSGSKVMRHSIVALNHVHDCYGKQGDGIEVKQGSYGNWIVENLVYNCNYPCIIAYGTGGKEVNIIERNICYNSNNFVIQVQGEAIVRNNLAINGAFVFHSHDHEGNSTNLTVVHNTFINTGRAVNLRNWGGRADMVFANNAVYSRDSAAINFPSGSSGVTITGNICFGAVNGASTGWITGNGLSDFSDLSWDATRRDAAPSDNSALLNAANADWAVSDDLYGDPRNTPSDVGAVER